MLHWDVAIFGGGPAGSAAAMVLRSREPQLSVALIEASRYESPRLGEVLPPAAFAVLEHLGVKDAVAGAGFREVHSAAVSWGGPVLAESPHLFTTHGAGLHLDRARFDAILAHEADRRGVQLCLGTRAVGISRSADTVQFGCGPGDRFVSPALGGGRQATNNDGLPHGWQIRLASGESACARFVIDATGRSAIVARSIGARIVPLDGLTGFACHLACEDSTDPRTVIEAGEHGWWYAAPLGNGSRVVALMTDSDIGRQLGFCHSRNWRAALEQTHHMGQAIAVCGLPADGEGRRHKTIACPTVRSANSQWLDPVCTENWLAAGDAASALDPLSGQGIVKSLRSGIFAAYAVGDWLVRRDSRPLERYRKLIRDEMASYQQVRARYYSEERRWPQSLFWRRRCFVNEGSNPLV